MERGKRRKKSVRSRRRVDVPCLLLELVRTPKHEDEPSSRRTRCDSVDFLTWNYCGCGLCHLVFPPRQRLPIRRPSPAGHDIEETTKNAFCSNDELPSLIETWMRTTVTTDPPPITDVVEV
ncbi:unnamed protein product [Tuber aestivum]|uniref:Uncharacterized protein n=1 Tax=Tuber aestivum TaxID=59557 RepID=A0A292PK71_9PEZI|nr:unnamed protein product [Tuber aestivum]